ncbi:MAG: pirin-like C-terminal cupin domain-containing protein, partial [Bacteroidales bacterium]
MHYLDVTLEKGADFRHALPAQHNAFVYVYEGSVDIQGTALGQHELAVLENGEGVALESGTGGARFVLVAGKPIGEPIV